MVSNCARPSRPNETRFIARLPTFDRPTFVEITLQNTQSRPGNVHLRRARASIRPGHRRKSFGKIQCLVVGGASRHLQSPSGRRGLGYYLSGNASGAPRLPPAHLPKDYPHRSKHAMEQQYSRTPIKPNDSRRRKASVDAVHTSVNGTDGANDGSDDNSGSDRDGSDSADARSRGPASRPTRKVRRVHTDSDENTKSKKKRSALKPRLSKRLKQSAKDQIPDDSDRPDEPVSTRPKRSRAPPKNYSLLLPNSDDLNEESDVAVAPEGLKKSKIVILGTGPPKKQQNGVREPDIKTVRSSASPDSVVEVRKSPVSPDEYQKGVRKSMRGKKMADDHLTTTRMGSDALRKKMKTPKGRKPRMLAHLDPSDVDTPSVPATASAKKGQKRKRSEDRDDNIRPAGRATTSPAPDAESEQPEKKKRRKQKVRHDLGFLPNGQPRMRPNPS
ncbi:MAG: hypothetical protein Q9193_002833 [Seirophora villosa]